MDSSRWLIHMVNSVLEGTAADGDSPADPGAFIQRMCTENGFDTGTPTDVVEDDQIDRLKIEGKDYQTVNQVLHALYLARPILYGRPTDIVGLELLAALAYGAGEVEKAQTLLELRDRRDDDDSDAVVTEIADDLGAEYLKRNRDLTHRFATHPFTHLRMRTDYEVLGCLADLIAIARGVPGGVPEEGIVYACLGAGENKLRRAISASIALANADGILDEEERTLIESMMTAARFGSTELAVLRGEYESPLSLAQLTEQPACAAERRYLYTLLFLGAHINGRHHESEQQFIEDLADRMGDSADLLDQCESQALANFETNYALSGKVAPEGLFAGIRTLLTGRFEKALQRNGRQLVKELGETKDLLGLMAKSVTQPLTEEEDARAKAQLADLIRAVPALAIFAAPGGAFLLPLVVKYLKVEIRPSSFVDSVRLGDEGTTQENRAESSSDEGSHTEN